MFNLCIDLLVRKGWQVKMYWGNNWMTPNQKQMEELLEKCTWVKVSNETHNGYKVTGPNGNSIFIPAGGYYSQGVYSRQDAIIISGDYQYNAQNGYGYGYSDGEAYGIINGQLFVTNSTRYFGYPVRAVLRY